MNPKKSDKKLVDYLYLVNKNSCPLIFNLHTHTNRSDGSLTPIQLIKQAQQHKIRHLAVTDHHTIEAYPLMKQWLNSKQKSNTEPLFLWSGIEITSLLKGCLVHILGLDFDIESNSMLKYYKKQSVTGYSLDAKEVVQAIHKANGLAVLAHPARYRLSYKELLEEAYNLYIDAIEVWYDYERSLYWKPSEFICDEIHKYANKLGFLATCGTDSHGLSLLKR